MAPTKTDETAETPRAPVAPYLDDPPPRGLFTRLARVGLLVGQLQEEAMDAIGLRFADYTILATLRREGAKEGVPVSRLAELVLRPMGSITQLVDRLAREGLVTREPDPSDRRMVRVALSEAGLKLARRGQQAYDRVHAQAIAGVDAETLERIDGGVRELLDTLERR